MKLFHRLPAITPQEAMERAAAGEITLVDVREPAELQSGRPPGATHIPLRQLPSRLSEIDDRRPVAFVCRSGARSARAARLAAKAGYEALNVRGGLMAWNHHSSPRSPRRGD